MVLMQFDQMPAYLDEMLTSHQELQAAAGHWAARWGCWAGAG